MSSQARSFVACLGLLLAAVLQGAETATGPDGQKVEIGNRFVRVYRSRLPAHGTRAVRDYVGSCVVYLTDVDERVTSPDGQVKEVRHKYGDVGWIEPGRYGIENLTDHPTEEVIIELKVERPKEAPVTLDPIKIDPHYHSVSFENERVRAIRTVLEPHLKGPMHEHPPYVVVYLTELHTTMKTGDGRQLDNPRKPGEIAYRDRLAHQTQNIGEKTAIEIQVELK
jgi:quercetin dioxygenase-like cupin family protein